MICRPIGDLIPWATGSGPMRGGTGQATNRGVGPVFITANGSWIQPTVGFGCRARNGRPPGSFGVKPQTILVGLRAGRVALQSQMARLLSWTCIISTTDYAPENWSLMTPAYFGGVDRWAGSGPKHATGAGRLAGSRSTRVLASNQFSGRPAPGSRSDLFASWSSKPQRLMRCRAPASGRRNLT